MGLAPYGEPIYYDKIRDNLIDIREDGSYRLNLDYFAYWHDLVMTNDKFENLFGGKKIVDNEIEVIQSKSLARQVVENLNLYAPIDVDGRITEQSAYLTCPIKISVLTPE